MQTTATFFVRVSRPCCGILDMPRSLGTLFLTILEIIFFLFSLAEHSTTHNSQAPVPTCLRHIRPAAQGLLPCMARRAPAAGIGVAACPFPALVTTRSHQQQQSLLAALMGDPVVSPSRALTCLGDAGAEAGTAWLMFARCPLSVQEEEEDGEGWFSMLGYFGVYKKQQFLVTGRSVVFCLPCSPSLGDMTEAT